MTTSCPRSNDVFLVNASPPYPLDMTASYFAGQGQIMQFLVNVSPTKVNFPVNAAQS